MNDDATVHMSRGWRRALNEHDAAVAAFLEVVSGIPEPRWKLPHRPGSWSAAEEVLHVTLSYEVALRGVRTGAGMRPRVSPMRAMLLRWLVLPVILASDWFPRARAPLEIRPPAGDASGAVDMSPAGLCERLAHAALEVRDELPASPAGLRFHHAYFGGLAPKQAMRMLAAHTRHHTRGMSRRFLNVME